MSGTGKSTLTKYAKGELEAHGTRVLILDGDIVREKYDVTLGFSREDVRKNNFNIAKICENERFNYDVIMVPVISPINSVRCEIKKLLSPGYNLLYISAELDSLKARDPKGLYKKADNGEITNLIGYSDNNHYDEPVDYDFFVDTSSDSDIELSKELFLKFILRKVFES